MRHHHPCRHRHYANEAGFYALGEDDEPQHIEITASKLPRETPWYETLIKATVPAAMTIWQQQQMTKLNLARINAGQAPMTAAQYAAVYQPPSARVQVGPDAQAEKLIMWGGAALLAFFAAKAMKII